MAERFMPPHGGYQTLLSHQKAQIVYDATVYFCDRFIDRRSRTHDQMVQAARSGKQNIIDDFAGARNRTCRRHARRARVTEGPSAGMASGTSKEMEIKLTNVARASLEELLADYRDFLRTRGLAEWPQDHRYTRRLRQLNRIPDATYKTFRKGIENADPAISAKVIIGLIRVTSYLLDRQLRSLEQSFLKDGGLRERMTRARLAARNKART